MHPDPSLRLATIMSHLACQMQERIQVAAALKAEAQMKRAMVEKDHMRRLEAVRDSNRRKSIRDAVAWLRQAARTPHEANMHRLVDLILGTHHVT